MIWGGAINIPNALSLIRFLFAPLVPLLAWNSIYLSFYLFTFLAVTDALDGIVARIYNRITYIGKLLDPLADKTLMFSGLFTVTFITVNKVDDLLFFTVLFRDISLVIGSIVLIPRGFRPEPALWGKLATLFQVIVVIHAFLINLGMNIPYLFITFWLALIFTVISWIYYIIKGIEFILGELKT